LLCDSRCDRCFKNQRGLPTTGAAKKTTQGNPVTGPLMCARGTPPPPPAAVLHRAAWLDAKGRRGAHPGPATPALGAARCFLGALALAPHAAGPPFRTRHGVFGSPPTKGDTRTPEPLGDPGGGPRKSKGSWFSEQNLGPSRPQRGGWDPTKFVSPWAFWRAPGIPGPEIGANRDSGRVDPSRGGGTDWGETEIVGGLVFKGHRPAKSTEGPVVAR